MALRYLAFTAGVTIWSVECGSWNAERGKELLSRMFEEIKDEQRYWGELLTNSTYLIYDTFKS